MVRNYQRKTSRGTTAKCTILEAVNAVKLRGRSIAQVSLDFNINYRSLQRYLSKASTEDLQENSTIPSFHTGYVQPRQVLTQKLGLTSKDVRKLAYQLADANKLAMPKSRMENHCAGRDWFMSFLQKNPLLSLRVPEATSIARAISFNKHNVEMFFNNLQVCFQRH
ncbi:uncharacterized protein LOC124807708 [Hydra vulgaris]|uniref:uncharacterized protein LOC124807708 n=1 Tax=Hydra vulgaris TaxID=6087 RepID=UPI001F5E8DAE|nr:uncharacterized protein LOC124807708 isoform X2 [Hydra vulgaris]